VSRAVSYLATRLSLAIAVAAVVVLPAIGLGPTAHAQQPADPAASGAPQPLNLQGRAIERVQFRGNRKVEDDAIRVQLLSKPGTLLDPAKLREDLRAMWKLGFFADIDVEAEISPSGGVILTFAVKERPSIRKVLVAGNSGLGLDKINEVIDLERDAIVNVTKIKRNRDKILERYVQEGFYLATVDYEIKPVNESEVDVWFTVDEKAKVKIREVQFIGNRAISDDELRGAIATRRQDALSFLNDSGVYNQEAFERDLLIISAYYWDRGYANVKVGTPQLRLSRDKQYMYLSIPIDEGPVFTIGDVSFKGDLIGTPEENAERLKLRSGMTFSRTVIAEDREKLSSFYQDQGYAYANVLPLTRVDLPNRKIHLTFEVARGKRAYFERINIRGNSKTRDKVIRREMKIAEGELFNNTNLEVSKRRITALGFFDNVVVSTKRGSSDEFVEVNVEVVERPTGTFQIGAGFSSVENFIAQAQISQNNLFGRGQTLALQAQISSLRQLFLLRFVEPYFLDTQWTFAFDLYNQSRGFETFFRNASGGTLTWGYSLANLFSKGPSIRDVRAFLTYKLENVSISQGSGVVANLGATSAPIEAERVANLYRGGITSSIRASLAWDSRNNRLFPSGGWYHTLFAEYADKYTGSPATTARSSGRSSSASTPRSVSPRRRIRSACRSRSATSSAASTTSVAMPRARSGRGSSPSAPATSVSSSTRSRSAATCSSSSTPRSSSRCSRRSASRASCSSTWATPTTSRTATARASSATTRRSRSSSTRASGSRSRSSTASASPSGSGSAGSRRSARCGSSGASRSTSSPARTRSCSSSRSVSSSRPWAGSCRWET
jgi:outer membrane protein insertion porin family